MEGGVARALGQKGLDPVREVIGLEQRRASVCGQRVGRGDAPLAVCGGVRELKKSRDPRLAISLRETPEDLVDLRQR